jgi:hypothetical protein
MFKLIKLAIYAMIGYALYELYQGMMQQQGGGGNRGGLGGAGGGSFGQSRSGGNIGSMTGGGSGIIDTTGDASGTQVPHAVGRGVISSKSAI